MPVKGVRQAVSDILIPQFDGKKDAVFDCTIKGLTKTLELLNEEDIKCTFFIEARTLLYLQENQYELVKPLLKNEIGCHGMDHEDLTGEGTGIKIDYTQQLKILKEATQIIKSVLNVKPEGFRAPYLKANSDTFKVLAELEYRYDSSIMMETIEPPLPYRIKEGKSSIIEVPIPVYPLNPRKMTLYTWALFEKQRKIEEYQKIIEIYQKNAKGGLLQITFHPWHLAYLIKEKRILKEKEIEKNVNHLRTLISQLKKEGNQILTVKEYIKEMRI